MSNLCYNDFKFYIYIEANFSIYIYIVLLREEEELKRLNLIDQNKKKRVD